MAWVYLILAGLFEIGWPIGLKIAQGGADKVKGVLIAVSCMAVSGALLYLAQRNIAMGTAYAIWTGIGASGTFLVGVYIYGDSATMMHYLGVVMIVGGVVMLKLAS